MSVKVFDTKEVQDLLKAASNAGSQDGEAARLAAGLDLEKYLDIRLDAADKEIEFNIELTPLVQGKDNQRVNRLRAAATA